MTTESGLDDRYLTDALEILAGPFLEGVDLLFDGDPAPFVKSSRSRRHLILAMCDQSPGAAKSAFSRFSEGSSDHKFLSWVYETAAPMLPCVLRRLGREPLHLGDYVRLNTAILANPRLGRALTQITTLTPERVRVALALPAVLQERSVIELCPGAEHVEALAELFRLAVKCNGRSENDLAFAVRRARTWSEIRRLLRRATTPQTLCEPPWRGDDKLVWVPTTSKLKETGGRLANCLLSFAEMKAREQDAAFYVWDGATEETRAVCAVVNERPFGWRIAEIEGYANQGISPTVRAEIVTRLAAHGVEDRPGVGDLLRAI